MTQRRIAVVSRGSPALAKVSPNIAALPSRWRLFPAFLSDFGQPDNLYRHRLSGAVKIHA